GTFVPIKVEDPGDHLMYTEWASLSQSASDAVNRAHSMGKRVIAVGSTSLRLLESASGKDGKVEPFCGDTNLFIVPGYQFKVVDLLLTNFHLPRSTLFMLVSAFAGLGRMQAAYAHAIKTGYRFFSYGDACLLEPNHEM
ncbi:MAG: tRNA preQ1(34) S-adenosylmethionine ribosyltransferase-isomerase QueA, partial [Magnetovibrio sp.]|nr:tRNA preQ1(34) S-adenosylmethionine ribosyltransferase-isomerase QueA [Magnetovibrio sp.]